MSDIEIFDFLDTPENSPAADDYKWEAIPGGVRLTCYNGLRAKVFLPSEYPAGSGSPVLELCGTFAGNDNIEEVFIPGTVRVIGERTFADCRNLDTLVVPGSVEVFEPSALSGCSHLRVRCPLNSAAWRCVEELPAIQAIIADAIPDANGYNASESVSEPDFMPEDMDMSMDMGYGGMFDNSGSFGDCQASWGGSYGYAPDPYPVPEPMPAPAPDMAFPPSAGRAEASEARLSAKKQAAKPVKVKPVRTDKVSFSALSPEKVERGKYASIQLFMYTRSQRKLVDEAIKAADTVVKEINKSGFSASRGSEVTIELCSDDVEVKDSRDTRVWDGNAESFDFMFFVPEDYKKQQIAFTSYVYLNGVQITRLNFTVDLRAARKSVPVKVKRRDNRHVFVSYAHKDTQRVLDQLVSIQEIAPKMTFWLDSQSLETGDYWRKEIKRAINRADALFLFWSVYSCASEEVEKEWRYALKKKGSGFITPVPLDPVEQCPPPAELSDRHFSHRSFHYSDEMDKLNFRTSKRVKVIK